MDVEFLQSQEPDDEPAPPAPPRRRWLVPGAIAALVAVVATLLVTHRDEDGGAPTTATSVTPAAPLISLPPRPAPSRVETGIDFDTWIRLSNLHCPATGTCTVLDGPGDGVKAALAQRFPHFIIGKALTTAADRTLWDRQISASDGQHALQIQVRRVLASRPPGALPQPPSSSAGATFARARVGHYVVDVQISKFDLSPALQQAMDALAHDPRLLRIG